MSEKVNVAQHLKENSSKLLTKESTKLGEGVNFQTVSPVTSMSERIVLQTQQEKCLSIKNKTESNIFT